MISGCELIKTSVSYRGFSSWITYDYNWNIRHLDWSDTLKMETRVIGKTNGLGMSETWTTLDGTMGRNFIVVLEIFLLIPRCSVDGHQVQCLLDHGKLPNVPL